MAVACITIPPCSIHILALHTLCQKIPWLKAVPTYAVKIGHSFTFLLYSDNIYLNGTDISVYRAICCSVQFQFVFPLYPVLLNAFCISFFDGTSFVTSACTFPTLLFPPVDTAEMIHRLAVNALHIKALVADPNIQLTPLIGSVLHLCPPLTPNADIFTLVMLTVFLLAKTIRSDSSGRNDDVNMGIIFRWINPVPAFMDRCNRAKSLRNKICINVLADDPYQLLDRQFVRQ